MKTKIIEFFGVPGAGKTTLKNQLINSIGESVLDFSIIKDDFIKGERIKYNLLKVFFIIKNIGILTKKNPNKESYKFIFDNYISKYLIKKYEDKYEYIILDQGFIQNIIAFYDNGELTDAKLLQKFIKNVDIDCFIFFHINVDTMIAQKRLLSRESSNNFGVFDSIKNNTKLKQLYINRERNTIKMLDFMHIRKMNVIDIDSCLSIKQNTDLIIKFATNMHTKT